MTSPKRLDQLEPIAHDLAARSIAWMDGCWDEAAGLFRMPGDLLYEAGYLGVPAHIVRETAWYAQRLSPVRRLLPPARCKDWSTALCKLGRATVARWLRTRLACADTANA